jgi:hypothetical protein
VVRPARTSLNELDAEVACGEEEGRTGRRVRFREDQESISIKLINSRNNDLSRKQLPLSSWTENPSAAKLIREPVLEEMESSEEMDSGPRERQP